MMKFNVYTVLFLACFSLNANRVLAVTDFTLGWAHMYQGNGEGNFSSWRAAAEHSCIRGGSRPRYSTDRYFDQSGTFSHNGACEMFVPEWNIWVIYGSYLEGIFIPDPKSQGDPTEATGNQPGSCPLVGHPIHAGTGNKYLVQTDYSGTGPSGLAFIRYYNSDGFAGESMGGKWTHTYDTKLQFNSDGLQATLVSRSGKAVTGSLNAGQWTAGPGNVWRLTQEPSGNWKLVKADDTTYLFDANGLLQSITKFGKTTTLSYNALNQLTTVVGPFGRSLSFTYNASGHLDSLTDPDNQTITYAYDTLGNLIRVTYPDTTTTRQYVYEDVNLPFNLTGIIDETGQRYATYAYDAQGRGILTELDGGTDRRTFVYNADGTTTVTNALGHIQTYHFTTVFGTRKTTQIDGGPCNVCGGQFSQTSYDANGFINNRTDFNGNRTTFINDSRGLQISRTEATGTPVVRTITTDWHPSFRLPTKITEPGKVTNFTYDANGRLLSRQEQAFP